MGWLTGSSAREQEVKEAFKSGKPLHTRREDARAAKAEARQDRLRGDLGVRQPGRAR